MREAGDPAPGPRAHHDTATSLRPTRHWRARAYLALGALWAGLTVFVRLYRLGASDPWLDEVWSLLVSQPPLPEVVRLMAADNNSPLYYVILHGVIVTWGATWSALRTPSAIASVLTLFPVAALGHWLGGRRAALAAAALFAVNPISVFYAQTARVYAMQALFFGLTAVAALRWRRWWWGVPFAVALYAHPLAALLLPALWIGALSDPAPGRRQTLRMLAVGTAVAFLLFLPWLTVTVDQVGRSVTDYLGDIWARWDTALVPLWSTGIVLGVDALPENVLYPRIATAYPAAFQEGPGRVAVRALVLGVVALVGIRAVRDARLRQLALLFGVSMGVHVLVSEFVRPVLLLGRHDVPYVPLLLPLVATVLCGEHSTGRVARIGGGVLLAIVIAFNGWWTVRYHLSPPYRHQPGPPPTAHIAPSEPS